MPSTLRNLVLLIAVILAGSLLVYYGIYLFRVNHRNQECTKNATSPNFQNNSLETKSTVPREEEGIGDVDGFTTHSIVLKNSEHLSENLRTGESIAKVVPRNSSFKGRFKRHTRRRKRRNAPKEKSQALQFNLNVTRLDNQTTRSRSKTDVTNDELDTGKQSQHLGAAPQVGGNKNPEDSDRELNSVEDSDRELNSVEDSLKHLHVTELSEKGHGIFIDFNGLPSKLQTDDPANAESPIQPRNKEGKFLFGLLGIRVNSENPPIDQGSGEAVGHTNITSVHDLKLPNSTPITESPLEMNSSVDKMEHTTQVSAISTDSADIQLLETTETLEKFEVGDRNLEEETTIEDLNVLSTPIAEFSKDTPEKQLKEDAEIEGSVVAQGNEFRGVGKSRMSEVSTAITQNTNVVDDFIIEDFRELCTILLQRMQKSRRRSDDLNDMEGSGNLEEKQTNSVPATSQEQITKVQQRPQNLGLFAHFLNLITGGRLQQESNTDGTDSNSSMELETGNRKARIFDFNNLFGSFGSGRSAQFNDFKNMEFDDMDFIGAHDIERDVPSASECIMFLRHIRNKNASVQPNFEEDLSLLDITTEFSSTEIVQENRIFNEGKGDNRSLILEGIEKQESIDNVNTKDQNTDQTGVKEGKFFNLIGIGNDLNVGSGSSELAEEKDRFLLGSLFNFGSGGREIKDFSNDPNAQNRLTSTVAPQDLRIIPGLLNFGSGERILEESFQFEGYTSDATTGNDERLFGGFLGLGSGERQIQEKFETTSDTTTDIFTDYFESEDALISSTGTNKDDRRFIGFLNLGSGDGRELLEPNEISMDRTQPDCVVCILENGTYPSIKCTKCPLETPIPLTVEAQTNHPAVSEAASNAMSRNVESFDDSGSSSTRSAVAETSEMEPILIGRLFLSGNGESTDQINLVHETESTSVSSSSLSSRGARRGRLDDEVLDDRSNSFSESFNDAKEVTPRNINPVSTETSSRVELIYKQTEDGLYTLSSSQDIESETQEWDTSTTVATTISPRDIKPKKRRCSITGQCDTSLNEQCIVKDHGFFCDCGRHFVRHPETWRCEEPALVKTSLKFPEEVFHEDLKDDSSERFHKMRKNSIETIKLLLSHGSELTALTKVDITGFEKGSLIVESDLVFAKSGRNQNVLEYVRKVHVVLKEALQDEKLLRLAPLDARGANLLSVSTVVPRCDTVELNICRCIPDGKDFRCKCNEGYLDTSRAGSAGEVCIEICPPNYCGDNGFCDLQSGEIQCRCSGWYFGGKCQINGIVVIGGFAAVNIFVVLVVAGAVYFCRRRRHRRSRYYGDKRSKFKTESFGHLSAVPSRLQNNVAMNELGGASTSKYQMTRSTPPHWTPMIHVTSPSIIGSSISYDFDSTFDRSVNIENEAVRL